MIHESTQEKVLSVVTELERFCFPTIALGMFFAYPLRNVLEYDSKGEYI